MAHGTRIASLLVLLLPVFGADGLEATLVAVSADRAVWRTASPVDWAPGTRLRAEAGGYIVEQVKDGRRVTCRRDGFAAAGPRLRDSADLAPVGSAGVSPTTPVAESAAVSGPVRAVGIPRRDRDRATGGENVVPGDDPTYAILAELAERGLVPGATPRQFTGDGEVLLTQRQIVDILAAMIAPLRGGGVPRQPWTSVGGSDAARAAWLIDRYRFALSDRGIDLAPVMAWLDAADAGGVSAFGWVAGEVRAGTGRNSLDARGELGGMVFWGDRLMLGATLGTDGTSAYDTGLERDDFRAGYLEWELSRHLTMTTGRLATRLGPGTRHMLWTDAARPLDGIAFRYHNLVFGRPFSIQQQTGTFADGARKYVTVNRYEYEAADGLTLAASFGLVTDRVLQGAASVVLPLYAARFVAGQGSRGGEGNFLGSLDVAWRLNPDWAIYGELFADDYDFSPAPPRSRQRIGWLGGVHLTPRGAPPGTGYRFEACILPDTGTYFGQQNPRLDWTRDGTVLGHAYGPDAAGWRFVGRHRFTSTTDLSLSFERYRQMRETASPARSTLLDVTLRQDLGRHLQLGVGYRHTDLENRGGVGGDDRIDDSLYLEARGRY